MASPLAGWRLPLRLAWRDIMRYKGRSALAALLILLPVMALATMLAFISTFEISPDEERARAVEGLGGLVTVSAEKPGAPMPAAGRAVTTSKPPTAAEVSEQAGVAALEAHQEGFVFAATQETTSGGFTSTWGTVMLTDATSPLLARKATLVSGRLPSKPGEVAVTEYGKNMGLPTEGPMQARSDSGNPSDSKTVHVTIVGTVTTPFADVAAVGPVPTGYKPSSSPGFLLDDTRTFSAADVEQWHRFGLDLTTRDNVSAQASAYDVNTTGDSSMAFAIAVATMAFVAVTALLAGPAFAAGATRQRRSLGLVAANGGTRAVLRRIVLANAMILCALTALVSAVLGTALGVVAAKIACRQVTTLDAPTDIRFSWIVGLVVVSTLAALIAAWVPARAAGRTNLLQALRGQVSARVVKRRLPTIGVIAVAAGTLCLFFATQRGGDGSSMSEEGQTALAYIGVPLFFGGAVLAVPYVLMVAGKLAGHLPLTPRLAVREVSRQRTRATASIGAVLATVAVCTGVSVYGASEDAYLAKTYTPSMPMGEAAFVSSSPGSRTSEADDNTAIAAIRKIVPGAAGAWTVGAGDFMPRYLAGKCPAKGSGQDAAAAAVSVLGVDDAGMKLMGLDAATRDALKRGEFLHVGPSTNDSLGVAGWGPQSSATTITDGKVTLAAVQWKNAELPEATVASCSPLTVPARPVSFDAAFNLAGSTPNSLIAARETLAKHHMTAHLAAITVAPEGGVSKKLEGQLKAASPIDMPLMVERGYSSPILVILGIMTAALAFVVLLTTIVSTLLNDAESQADAATLATVGAPTGMRRRIVGAHAAAIGVIGALIGIAVGIAPGLILARASTNHMMDERTHQLSGGTYAIPWWSLAIMLIAVPLVAALVSMLFARRKPVLTRRER